MIMKIILKFNFYKLKYIYWNNNNNILLASSNSLLFILFIWYILFTYSYNIEIINNLNIENTIPESVNIENNNSNLENIIPNNSNVKNNCNSVIIMENDKNNFLMNKKIEFFNFFTSKNNNYYYKFPSYSINTALDIFLIQNKIIILQNQLDNITNQIDLYNIQYNKFENIIYNIENNTENFYPSNSITEFKTNLIVIDCLVDNLKSSAKNITSDLKAINPKFIVPNNL